MLEVRGQEHMKRVVAAVFSYADGQLGIGKSPGEVELDLVSKGMEPEAATSVVEKIVSERSRQAAERARLLARRERERLAHRRRVMAMRAEAARQSMTTGALICLAGVAISFFFTFAGSWGNALYLLSWAAILFGAIRFLRGASLASTTRAQAREEAVAPPAQARRSAPASPA